MSAVNTQLKKRIIRRVYIISVMRRVFHPTVLKSIILTVFMVMGSILVSVPNIISNMPLITDINASLSFVLRAFLHTETLVQMVSLGSTILAIWLIKDALRSFSSFGHHNNRQLVA